VKAQLFAQGGIAAVFDETDSVESHVEDTLIAGAGIVERQAAEFVASNARQCVQWLIDQGVAFDTVLMQEAKAIT
jgi:L-aspartate oxidase